MKTIQKEIPYFNYLKFALIFLVVFGHLVTQYATKTHWFSMSIYQWIFSFHMPLFVFVSGFFAKYNKKYVLKYFILFCIFQVIGIMQELLALKNNTINIKALLTLILTPRWALWYLLTLSIWILSLKFLKQVKWWHIAISIIPAIAIGFIESYYAYMFAINRLFYFYPFFLLGHKLANKPGGKGSFIKTLKTIKNPITTAIAVCCLIVYFAIIYYKIFTPEKKFFYGTNDYQTISGVINRLAAMSIGFIIGFMFMLIIPIKETGSKYIFSPNRIGKETLSIYLIHILLLPSIRKYLKITYSNDYILMLYLIEITMLIIMVSSLPFFNRIFNWNFYKHKKPSTH